MRHEATPHEHGNSVAAWTAVAIITVGFLIGAFAFFVAAPWVFVLGIAVALVGVLAGKLLSMAGLGSMPSYGVQEPADSSIEGPDLADRPSQPAPRQARRYDEP
jgi:hypothetical protein